MKNVRIDQGKTYYKMVSDEGTAVLDITFDFDSKCWLVSSKEPTTAFAKRVYMGIHQKEAVVTLAIKMLRISAESRKREDKLRFVFLISFILFVIGVVISLAYPPLDGIVWKCMPVPIVLGLVYMFYSIYANRRRGV